MAACGGGEGTAGQLIAAAHALGDSSVPGTANVCHNIYRWERGTNGLSEPYRLYYSKALGLPPDLFGVTDRPARPCGTVMPAEQPMPGVEAEAVLCFLAGVTALWQQVMCPAARVQPCEADHALSAASPDRALEALRLA